jgi:hypothetical protein
MKKYRYLGWMVISILWLMLGCAISGKQSRPSTSRLPANITGHFTDDYGISYSINEKEWIQLPNIKYHIIKYDSIGQYLIAKNAATNPSEAGLYTRIDWMYFTGMEPWEWGFCLTRYNASTQEEAIAANNADRSNPKKGCGGYPFSRMKRRQP